MWEIDSYNLDEFALGNFCLEPVIATFWLNTDQLKRNVFVECKDLDFFALDPDLDLWVALSIHAWITTKELYSLYNSGHFCTHFDSASASRCFPPTELSPLSNFFLQFWSFMTSKTLGLGEKYLSFLVNTFYGYCVTYHNSPLYDECQQSLSAKVLTPPWEWAHWDNCNDTFTLAWSQHPLFVD